MSLLITFWLAFPVIVHVSDDFFAQLVPVLCMLLILRSLKVVGCLRIDLVESKTIKLDPALEKLLGFYP